MWFWVHLFCPGPKRRIDRHFSDMRRGEDYYIAAQVGTQALKGYYPTLSDGIIRRRLEDYLPKDRPRE